MTGDALTDDRLFAILDAHAPWRRVALVPALFAWHAEDELGVWQALEDAGGVALPPPFFCVPWPGAQGLALAIQDGLVDVRDRQLADVGAGSGIASAAAMRAGAASVLALDLDPLALRAAQELGRRHGVAIRTRRGDALTDPGLAAGADVILCGDVIYASNQQPLLARAIETWRARAVVVLADSGRPHFDPCGLPLVLERTVNVPRALDGATSRTVRVYRGDPATVAADSLAAAVVLEVPLEVRPVDLEEHVEDAADPDGVQALVRRVEPHDPRDVELREEAVFAEERLHRAVAERHLRGEDLGERDLVVTVAVQDPEDGLDPLARIAKAQLQPSLEGIELRDGGPPQFGKHRPALSEGPGDQLALHGRQQGVRPFALHGGQQAVPKSVQAGAAGSDRRRHGDRRQQFAVCAVARVEWRSGDVDG